MYSLKRTTALAATMIAALVATVPARSPVTVNILDLTTNKVILSCTVPNNAAQVCGTFLIGVYKIQLITVCGSETKTYPFTKQGRYEVKGTC
jgi:hypothetical protein